MAAARPLREDRTMHPGSRVAPGWSALVVSAILMGTYARR